MRIVWKRSNPSTALLTPGCSTLCLLHWPLLPQPSRAVRRFASIDTFRPASSDGLGGNPISPARAATFLIPETDSRSGEAELSRVRRPDWEAVLQVLSEWRLLSSSIPVSPL